MCGLVAIKYKDKERASLDLEELTGLLAHRGPDEAACARLGDADLGFRRLGIIDLETGQQPMYNEDQSLCLVFNGEIYNYRPLREELRAKGHQFRSRADSEVLIHLYEEEGIRAVERLRGMFAFCLYDRSKNEIFGARDRFGIKPLYYTHTPWGTALASEAKVLLELPGVRRKVNMPALDRYLTFQYVPEPETMFEGIFRIPPAHRFTVTGGSLKMERYWEATFAPRLRPFDQLVGETRDVLSEAVAVHLQSDVPLGAFLSGGIDSTIVVALLRERGPISTFSVGYEHPRYSELGLARETARYLETDHHEYLIGPREFWEALPRQVWHMDDPVADPSAQSLYLVARMAREHVTVVLSGEGADEVFGGYDIYREPLSLRYLSWFPRPLKKVVGSLSSALPPGLPGKGYLGRASVPLRERYVGNAFIFTDEEKARLMKGTSVRPYTDVTAPFYDRARGYDEFTTMQYIDIHTWMVGDILMKADKMTMANSLELRVPFLDHHVFDLASTIPTSYKVRGRLTKYLLRQAFSDLIPPEVISRPKLGFPVPTRAWLQESWGSEVDDVLLDPAMAAFFSPARSRRLLDDHRQGRADNSRKLFTLIVFSLWWDAFMR